MLKGVIWYLFTDGPAPLLIPWVRASSWLGEWRLWRQSLGITSSSWKKWWLCQHHHCSNDSWPIIKRYGVSGWLEDLPSLTQGRESHGCGAYTDQGNMVREHLIMVCWHHVTQVLLVTGGWDGVSRGLDSTEILDNPDSGKLLVGVNFIFLIILRLETDLRIASHGSLGA